MKDLKRIEKEIDEREQAPGLDGVSFHRHNHPQNAVHLPLAEVEAELDEGQTVVLTGSDTAALKPTTAAERFATNVAQLFRYGWPLMLFALTLLFRRLLFADTELAEFYAAEIRPVLMWPLTAVTNLVPFSLSFVFLIGVGLLALVIVLRLLFCFRVKKGERLLYVLRHFRCVAGVLSVAFLLYMLFHGGNFARYSLAEQFGYTVRKHSSLELYNAAVWLREEASSLRSGLAEDEAGAYQLPENETVKTMLAEAHEGYAGLEGSLAHFAGQAVRPKIVPLSNYWSYTATAGMFFPLLGEANVNTDMRPDEILSAAMHEIAHTKGIAREDEANFMAFYTGIHHPSKDQQYAAFLAAFIQSSNQLHRSDKALWVELWADVPDTIRRDLAARNEYWDQFKGPVKETAQKVNNNFLMANGEDDGIKSYGRMVDLVLAYYEYEVLNANRLAP